MRNCLSLPLLSLVGCGPRLPTAPSLLELPIAAPSAPDVWSQIAYVGAWAGAAVFAVGVLLLIAGLVFRVGPGVKTAVQLLLAGLSLSVSMQAMLFIGPHIKFLALVALGLGLLAALAYGWLHRKYLERYVGRDLDGDKKIFRGVPPKS